MVRLEALKPELVLWAREVSIPIWCDWKCLEKAAMSPFKKFQFLYGAIGRREQVRPTSISLVSIPIWCDWKGNYAIFSNSDKTSFNSYMVRLEDARRTTTKRLLSGFNSYMVRLELNPMRIVRPLSKVSIPIWCDWKVLWEWLRKRRLLCFNSYMVRLEDPF